MDSNRPYVEMSATALVETQPPAFLALIIDKPILDLLQIGEDTPLELVSDGDRLMVAPIRDKRRQRKLRASLDKINARFGEDLRRLAE